MSVSEMYYGNYPKGPHIPGYMNLNEYRGTVIEGNEVFKAYDELLEINRNAYDVYQGITGEVTKYGNKIVSAIGSGCYMIL